MTVYRKFICDFPSRCSRILSDYERRATLRGLEVTTMPAIASAGLIIPYERLKRSDHPSGDRSRFQKAVERFEKIGNRNFLEDFLEGESGSWQYGEIMDDTGMVEQWKNSTVSIDRMETGIITGKVGRKKKTCYILNCLRNSLAHGNVFTPGRGVIKDLVFLSRIEQKRKEYSVVVVSPVDFRGFLQKWFQSVREIEMPESVVAERYTAAMEGYA